MYLDRLEVNFENKPCYDIVISDDFSGLKKELNKLDMYLYILLKPVRRINTLVQYQIYMILLF